MNDNYRSLNTHIQAYWCIVALACRLRFFAKKKKQKLLLNMFRLLLWLTLRHAQDFLFLRCWSYSCIGDAVATRKKNPSEKKFIIKQYIQLVGTRLAIKPDRTRSFFAWSSGIDIGARARTFFRSFFFCWLCDDQWFVIQMWFCELFRSRIRTVQN